MRLAADRLNWSPGHEGKGLVTSDGDVHTFNIGLTEPSHQELWQNMGVSSQPVFYFYVGPDGSLHDGQGGNLIYGNRSGKDDQAMLAEICHADPRLFVDDESSPFED